MIVELNCEGSEIVARSISVFSFRVGLRGKQLYTSNMPTSSSDGERMAVQEHEESPHSAAYCAIVCVKCSSSSEDNTSDTTLPI